MSTSTPPQTVINYINQIQQKGNEAKQKNADYYNQAKDLLQQWLQQGKITQDDYNQMMNILTNWKTTMDQSIDDIVSTSVTAVNAGYNAGKAEGEQSCWKWTALAGVGGFALGVIVGKH
jgi:polyhydroxyalkanoate synthesis regulator phasin